MRKRSTETRVAYDNSTWHAINTRYIKSTKDKYKVYNINSIKETLVEVELSQATRVSVVVGLRSMCDVNFLTSISHSLTSDYTHVAKLKERQD